MMVPISPILKKAFGTILIATKQNNYKACV